MTVRKDLIYEQMLRLIEREIITLIAFHKSYNSNGYHDYLSKILDKNCVLDIIDN